MTVPSTHNPHLRSAPHGALSTAEIKSRIEAMFADRPAPTHRESRGGTSA
ncbi:hypothetical protein GCM10023094_34400 [Rhodococcus olei]|uniref:Uncharacterized protein n=1 Tax=Rhodococcus olei TaxID=2161675 RepID=A0ABP8PA37_9NOCA